MQPALKSTEWLIGVVMGIVAGALALVSVVVQSGQKMV
jgi:hypothetical protein